MVPNLGSDGGLPDFTLRRKSGTVHHRTLLGYSPGNSKYSRISLSRTFPGKVWATTEAGFEGEASALYGPALVERLFNDTLIVHLWRMARPSWSLRARRCNELCSGDEIGIRLQRTHVRQELAIRLGLAQLVDQQFHRFHG